MLVTYPTNLNLQLNLHARRRFSLLRSVQLDFSQLPFHLLLLQPLRLRLVLHVCFAVCTQRILSFLYVVSSKVKLFGVPSFPDSSIFLFQGMFSLSRLNFTFFLFLFIVLCFQCSRCFIFSVSRKYFSVL